MACTIPGVVRGPRLEPHGIEKALTNNAIYIEGKWEHCSLSPGGKLGISYVD